MTGSKNSGFRLRDGDRIKIVGLNGSPGAGDVTKTVRDICPGCDHPEPDGPFKGLFKMDHYSTTNTECSDHIPGLGKHLAIRLQRN
jgi:hypothetical protein